MAIQKIDGITLEAFEIVIAISLVYNKAEQICFFEKTFLFDNIVDIDGESISILK